jgi:hypothetical protein
MSKFKEKKRGKGRESKGEAEKGTKRGKLPIL